MSTCLSISLHLSSQLSILLARYLYLASYLCAYLASYLAMHLVIYISIKLKQTQVRCDTMLVSFLIMSVKWLLRNRQWWTVRRQVRSTIRMIVDRNSSPKFNTCRRVWLRVWEPDLGWYKFRLKIFFRRPPTHNEVTPDLARYKFRPKYLSLGPPTYPKWDNTRFGLIQIHTYFFSQEHPST